MVFLNFIYLFWLIRKQFSVILGTKIINDLSCSNGKYDYDTENYVYCPTNTCSQCPGVEIKGISLLQLPASGISLQAEKRVETRQDLRQHSLDWKQGDLWLIRKIIILSHSETQHTGRCPLSSTRYEVAESTEVGASSAPAGASLFQLFIRLLRSNKRFDAKHWEMQFFGECSFEINFTPLQKALGKRECYSIYCIWYGQRSVNIFR